MHVTCVCLDVVGCLRRGGNSGVCRQHSCKSHERWLQKWGVSRWFTPLACGPGSPELSKSNMDMASKFYTFTFPKVMGAHASTCPQMLRWSRASGHVGYTEKVADAQPR